MPFNVCDKNGKHIGFIKDSYPYYTNVFRIALTEERIEDKSEDLEEIKKYLAGLYSCKTILGKVDKSKFEKNITNLLDCYFPQFKEKSNEEFIKFLLLKNCTEIERYICLDKGDIRGYILLDIDSMNIENNTVVLNEEIDYIEDIRLDEETPIYAKVANFPVVMTDIMGFGKGLLLGADIADLGGRNHIHTTKFKMQSGNSITDIEIPAQLGIKKGMNIQLYFNENKISKIFCDGVIYMFN